MFWWFALEPGACPHSLPINTVHASLLTGRGQQGQYSDRSGRVPEDRFPSNGHPPFFNIPGVGEQTVIFNFKGARQDARVSFSHFEPRLQARARTRF